MILLSEHQLALFDYLPKPTIPLFNRQKEQKTLDLIYFQEEKNFEDKVKRAVKSYHVCKLEN